MAKESKIWDKLFKNMAQESELEKKLCKEVKALGGLALKFVSPGLAGMPDRLILIAIGKIGFVEVTALMNVAKEKAKEQGRRAVILEMQSCNVAAMAFYRSQGFHLIGFDSCCYTNRDVEKCEVRFNMGFCMDQREGRW